MKINVEKSFFGCSELEYLGYWITRDGIQPLPKKIDAIQAIEAPTTKQELRRFLGMVNYYRDMWQKCSEILAPLSALSSKVRKWEWTDVHQKAFKNIKQTLSKETLLAYPDFNKTFIIEILKEYKNYKIQVFTDYENLTYKPQYIKSNVLAPHFGRIWPHTHAHSR